MFSFLLRKVKVGSVFSNVLGLLRKVPWLITLITTVRSKWQIYNHVEEENDSENICIFIRR